MFTDVLTGKWYTEAVAWAKKNNIMNGVSAKDLPPIKTYLVSRLLQFWDVMQGSVEFAPKEEVVSMLMRYVKFKK